ncbi:hypothetical protein JCM8547_000577 [Rhodosporidiobolus lusitaniae]
MASNTSSNTAGVEIHLCLRECQKLVWYGHKHVCGSKPGVFNAPELDNQEILLMKELVLTDPTRLPQGKLGSPVESFSKQMERILAMSKEQISQQSLLEITRGLVIDDFQQTANAFAMVKNLIPSLLAFDMKVVLDERYHLVLDVEFTPKPA